MILALGARPGGVHPSEWCVSGGKFGGSRSGHAGLRLKCVGVNAWRSGGRGKRAGTLLLQRSGQPATSQSARRSVAVAKARPARRHSAVTKNGNPVEEYLGALDEPKQSSLRQLRQSILEVIPEAEECMSYGLPAFRVRGQVIAGFGAFKNHLSYFPYSGSVITEVGPDAASTRRRRGRCGFPSTKPSPILSCANSSPCE